MGKFYSVKLIKISIEFEKAKQNISLTLKKDISRLICFFDFPSGPCMTLLLSKATDSPDVGDGTIEYFRDLIGPKDVNIAKEEAPTR